MPASPQGNRLASCVGLALIVGVALGIPAPGLAPGQADAALVCEHQRKPLVRLRVNACKRTERAVFDTGSEAAQDARLATVERRSGDAVTVVGLTCAQDPARRPLVAQRDLAGGMMMLGYVSASLCRTLDDDPAACAQAFESSTYGPTACAVVRGKCFSCHPLLELSGICRNACQPAIACVVDPARPTGRTSCSDATTPALCAQSWSVTSAYATPTDILRPTTCFWDAAAIPPACDECDPTDVSRGLCANTCLAAADLPRCRVARGYGRCSALDGNPAACVLTYEAGPFGTQTCWYDAGPAACRGCDPLVESMGMCDNGC